MTEYHLPDPKKEPVKCLVISYKVSKGVEYDNRHWDKSNFARCMCAAQTLLSLCQTIEYAEECLRDLSNDYENKGLSWTLETIARNSHEWLLKKGKINANASRARLRMAIAERRATPRSEGSLEPISKGTLPNPVRVIQEMQSGAT